MKYQQESSFKAKGHKFLELSPGAVSLPVVSNALTKAWALAAVVVELSVVEAGLSLTYTGDIGAPIVALLGNIF